MGERPTPDAPEPSKRRPPPGTLMPPPQRAKPAGKSARGGVGDGSPRPHHPQPQPVGSGPRPPARGDEWSGVGERPTPDAQYPGKRRSPRGTLVPPPQRAKPARKSARGGVRDRSPRPHLPQPQPVGSGPRPHARKDKWSGWESARPLTPHSQARGAPPGAPSCHLHSAQSKLARARAVELVTGPHALTPRTHSQWLMGLGRTPQRTGGRGWESAQSRTPRPEAPPPRAPSCHPHSAQSQLPRARAVGLVTDPHARTPCTHSQWVVGPGCTPERTSGRGWESAQLRTPHT